MRTLSAVTAAMILLAMPAAAEPAPAGLQPSEAARNASDPLAPQPATVTVACCPCIGGTTTTKLYTGTQGWQLTSSPPLSDYHLYIRSVAAWTASMPTAQWIGPHATDTGHYIYELHIIVPNCTIPGTFKLTGYAAADNMVTAYLIGPNGTQLMASSPNSTYGFQQQNIIGFYPVLSPNTSYILKMDVSNQNNDTGLLVNAWIDLTCTTNLIWPNSRPAPDSSSKSTR